MSKTLSSILRTGNTTNTPLLVTNGGTGLSTPGATGNILTSNGSVWVSQAAPVTGVSSLKLFYFINQ